MAHGLFESSVTLHQPICHHNLDVIGLYGDHARTRKRTVAGNRNRGVDITGNERKMPSLRAALLPFAAAAGRPGRLTDSMNDKPLTDDSVVSLGIRVSAWKKAIELTGAD